MFMLTAALMMPFAVGVAIPQTQDAAENSARSEKKICKTIESTGSRLGGRKVCKTREQWNAEAKAAADLRVAPFEDRR